MGIDTIYIEKWDVINEASSIMELSAKEWYVFTENGLVWIKVQRKRGDFWDDLEPEFLNRFYFKQLK